MRRKKTVEKKSTLAQTLEQACGQVIVQLREERGLSQIDLAVAAGYSLRYIGDVERGTKSATLRTMNDLATLLDLRLGDLIARAERRLDYRDKRTKDGRSAAGPKPGPRRRV